MTFAEGTDLDGCVLLFTEKTESVEIARGPT
jgi:hypothetical protein